MRLNSTLRKSLFLLLIGTGFSLTYAQVDPEVQDSVVVDSLDYEQDILLSETVIIGKGIIDLEEDRQTPVAVSTIKKEEIQDKAVGNVEFPEIMKNTPSVYVANQAGGFGDSEMFLRGFEQSNTAFLLNGQPINGMEDGNMYWSNWSSMTDVANAIQVQRGLGSSKLAISSVGGTVNIVTKATEKTQGGMARFVMGNDSYMKGTVAYDTGLKGKWGFSILLDYWTGHRKYAIGTAGQGQSYFVSVGYKPNDHHNLNFMIFGAPQWHFQNFSKSKELYNEFGRKYNNNYGYYNGEGYSIRKNYYHKPVANLNWDWSINSNASLSTVLYASLGRGGGTGPLGSGAAFIDGGVMDNGYINFNAFETYNANLTDEDGNPVNVGTGRNGAAIRGSVNNHFWYGLVSNFNYDTKSNFTFNLGADIRFYKGDHFYQLVDLFGLQGWDYNGDGNVVTETFEADPWAALFNNADENQRFNYDYSEWINYQGGFGQVEYKAGGFSAFLQGAVSNQSYRREERMDVDALGKSESISKIGYNAKGGLAYEFNDHTFFGNAGYYSRQPYLDNIFDNVRSGNDLKDPEVDNEEITGFEIGYRYSTKNLRVNVNAYHTTWGNRFLAVNGSQDFEIDGEIQPVDITKFYTDITQVHKGIEIDFDTKLSRKWTLRGSTSFGEWKYDGSSPYKARRDDTSEYYEEGEDSLDGIYIGNAPQFTFGMGTKFEVVKGLSFDADMNYYARLWGEVGSDAALEGEQSEELAPYAIFDAGVTYVLKLSGKQNLRFRGNVYNVANTQYIGRKDGFGYYFGLGRTFNAGVQFNF